MDCSPVSKQPAKQPGGRRRAIVGGTAALAALGGCRRGDAAPEAAVDGTKLPPYEGPTPPLPMVRRVPVTAEVEVPYGFTGMHFHRWPHGSSPTPKFPFNAVRSLNYDPTRIGASLQWNKVERTEGKFDWQIHDKWVEHHIGAKRELMYCFYGTPTWCSTRPTVKDLGNALGADSKPTDLALAERFITALIKRYNGDGVRRIKWLELWNEPDFRGGYYWRDTAADLAALSRVAYRAAKAVDPGITVLSPAFVNWFSPQDKVPAVFRGNVVAWADAADGAGATGKKWMDALNFHIYAKTTDMNEFMDHQDSMRHTARTLGVGEEGLILSELGFVDGYAKRFTVETISTTVRRWVALSAAYGNRFCGLYSYESDENLGEPAKTPVISDAIADVYGTIVGTRIRHAGVLKDGSVWLVHADGRATRY